MEAARILLDDKSGPTAAGSPEPSPISQLRPLRPEEGFLLETADWEDLGTKYDRQVGAITTSVVTLTDTSRFVFRKTVPAEQRWDTSVDYSDPLATRVDGFNTYIARKLAQRGIHSRIVGTNQRHGFDLLHDAQAMLHILNEDDQRQQQPGQQTCAPGESFGIGYSMGAMKLLLVLGLAPEMDRDIKASVGLDPCLAEKVDYRQELRNIGCSLRLAKYLGREALEIPLNVGRSLIEDRAPLKTLRRTAHLASTAGLSPAYLANLRDKWNVLATGETGEYLQDIPKDAIMVIHFFSDSYFNDNEFYEESLAGHPFFRPVEEAGLHLSGASARVVGRMTEKAALGLELLDQGAAPADLADALATPVLRA